VDHDPRSSASGRGPEMVPASVVLTIAIITTEREWPRFGQAITEICAPTTSPYRREKPVLVNLIRRSDTFAWARSEALVTLGHNGLLNITLGRLTPLIRQTLLACAPDVLRWFSRSTTNTLIQNLAPDGQSFCKSDSAAFSNSIRSRFGATPLDR